MVLFFIIWSWKLRHQHCIGKNWLNEIFVNKRFQPAGNFPANRRRWHNVGIMLTHRLRRWANINPALNQCLVFTELSFHRSSNSTITHVSHGGTQMSMIRTSTWLDCEMWHCWEFTMNFNVRHLDRIISPFCLLSILRLWEITYTWGDLNHRIAWSLLINLGDLWM